MLHSILIHGSFSLYYLLHASSEFEKIPLTGTCLGSGHARIMEPVKTLRICGNATPCRDSAPGKYSVAEHDALGASRSRNEECMNMRAEDMLTRHNLSRSVDLEVKEGPYRRCTLAVGRQSSSSGPGRI